ncbi:MULTISPECIES: glycoside hydrolase family 18 protein [Microbispora]|jgi:chitinase|uniref:glycoside hydrolase family 18 protein n=1 Tax=Microbispora TaxID=2005 RepID=UPI001F111CBA|nr:MULTISPECIES: glycosyl hydrolase family 18 protein [unclassified Microbispora]
MGAITRGAFAVVVLSAVLSSLFVACYDLVRATETGVSAVGQTQARTRVVVRKAAAAPAQGTPARVVVAPAQGASAQGAALAQAAVAPAQAAPAQAAVAGAQGAVPAQAAPAQAAVAPAQAAPPQPASPEQAASARAAAPVPEVTVTVTVTPSPSPSPGRIRVGYVSQRGAYGATSTVRDLDTSGLAGRLTHVLYAFANIDPESLTCLSGVTQPLAPDPNDPDQGDGAGDAWADYQRGFTAAESLDGVADPPDAPLAGNFNQLKKLKARHPGLKALISIGGWTYSKYFSDVARTAAARQRFVKSCLDAYIRGDLPGAGGRGGPGSAAGVFDGIDIDWEWPGGGGHLGNHTGADDRRNLTALLAEFRAQLDALGEATGRHYLLTVYLPADADRIDAGFELERMVGLVDFVNVQREGRHAVREGAILR